MEPKAGALATIGPIVMRHADGREQPIKVEHPQRPGQSDDEWAREARAKMAAQIRAAREDGFK